MTADGVYSGLLSQVNLWDQAYTDLTMYAISRAPGLWKGNAASWAQLRGGARGAAQLVSPSSTGSGRLASQTLCNPSSLMLTNHIGGIQFHLASV